MVNVEGVAGDSSKVSASGPGIKPIGVQAGKQNHFDINTTSNEILNFMIANIL